MKFSAVAATIAALVVIFHAQFGELCQTLNHDQCRYETADASISNLCFRRKCIRAEVIENSYCRTNAQCRRRYRQTGYSRRAVGCRKSRCYTLTNGADYSRESKSKRFLRFPYANCNHMSSP
ncbi:hypothetical protein M514_00694 [Trichuris suis]|uniref:Uncharacterized protein n=1 Tax=Trichuris suis TaxID=68888 RepID=A0A085MMM2_9BILA|nr:hypothetical protein M513_00694 [Trichuris suis]KFD65098.1 hypothetical protein M514_00694 [Trichuris suis]